MAVLVVSGSGCNAGKTAVGCAVIRDLPQLCWTAVKTTPHDYHPGEIIWEENDVRSSKDTGRYLASGAQHAYLVASAADDETLKSSLAAIRSRICSGHCLLVESNRVRRDWLVHDQERSISLAILSGISSEWKSSLLSRAAQADALVLTGGFCGDQLPSELRLKRVFQMVPGQWSSPELLKFIRRGLLG